MNCSSPVAKNRFTAPCSEKQEFYPNETDGVQLKPKSSISITRRSEAKRCVPASLNLVKNKLAPKEETFILANILEIDRSPLVPLVDLVSDIDLILSFSLMCSCHALMNYTPSFHSSKGTL
ncbi:Hypothetical protein NTJ_03618 [Nesidiocoris tenuis]|uniref:Uncharacterized protein n=1 Tax=Nesidiocoris tenuis TaxID=355587 RepID=A0ABN7AIW7_9HEMI|nr:Hypothetical protein NTJ_03618 [Nesidiocoris tenuis]